MQSPRAPRTARSPAASRRTRAKNAADCGARSRAVPPGPAAQDCPRGPSAPSTASRPRRWGRRAAPATRVAGRAQPVDECAPAAAQRGLERGSASSTPARRRSKTGRRMASIRASACAGAAHDPAVLGGTAAAPAEIGSNSAGGGSSPSRWYKVRAAGGRTGRTGSRPRPGCSRRTTRTNRSSRTAPAAAPRRARCRVRHPRHTRSNAAFASHNRSQARFFAASPIQVASDPYTQLPAITAATARLEAAGEALRKGQNSKCGWSLSTAYRALRK